MTAEGRLPVVREHKRPHGEASTYETRLNNVDADFVCLLDFGYGTKRDEAIADLIANAPADLEFLLAAVDPAPGWRAEEAEIALGRRLEEKIARRKNLNTRPHTKRSDWIPLTLREAEVMAGIFRKALPPAPTRASREGKE